MRLSARPLTNYNSVNSFDYVNQWTIRSGEPNVLYFQLIDLDETENSIPLRYMAGIGSSNTPASITVTFPAIDTTQVITVNATQDPNDSSIWSISLTSTQTPNSGNVKFSVTQGTTIRNFSVLNFISVEYPNNNGCDNAVNDANINTFNPSFGG